MTLATLTGNYGFSPLLTLTLCLSLIDDSWLNSWTGSGLTYKGEHRLSTLSCEAIMGSNYFCVFIKLELFEKTEKVVNFSGK